MRAERLFSPRRCGGQPGLGFTNIELKAEHCYLRLGRALQRPADNREVAWGVSWGRVFSPSGIPGTTNKIRAVPRTVPPANGAPGRAFPTPRQAVTLRAAPSQSESPHFAGPARADARFARKLQSKSRICHLFRRNALILWINQPGQGCNLFARMSAVRW